ncbi:MAG: hypothetical protein ACYDA3_14335 [Gaiellaceae bacterium]
MHEQAWADALATEHAHQRELLATLRGELGAFAQECAGALTALDFYVSALGGVVAAVDTARTVHTHVDLAADVYARIGGDAKLPVEQANDLLRTEPKRSDRELLQAIVAAAGVRARFEELVGPAPLAALSALAPLAKWKESRPGLREVTASAAQAAGGAAADTAALASTLRDAVTHVEGAARAVRDGKLEQVLAESRAKLEADLDALHAVIHDAQNAPQQWLDARHDEFHELEEEVRVKLDRVERVRRALGMLLPHLQALVRGLSVAERVQTVDGHRGELLSALGSVWDAAIPSSGSHATTAHPRLQRRWLVAAALVAVAIIIALVISLASGGSKKTVPPATAATTQQAPSTAAATPTVAPAPKLTPVHAEFVEAQRETVYTISATGGGAATYSWQLTPPKGNPGCNRFAPVSGKPNEAVWHHADTDGCTHTDFQHEGLVTVTVTTADWKCTATFFGTLTKNGPAPQRCRRV